jgi:methionyl-tRNA formyltransferase
MKIVFMGTPLAAAVSLERLVQAGHDVLAVYTQPDRPAGRGNKITQSAVKQLALERGLPVFQPLKIKSEETWDEFRAHKADVVVVVAYGRILPARFLMAFPMGAINVHFSLLPLYRGAAPVNWAIVNGDRETGVTTMQMDAGLDTGPILLQRSTMIGEDETSIDLMSRLSEIGAELLVETLERYPQLTPKKQEDDKATLAPLMKKEDGLISWVQDAADITNRIRGFQPFPTAFTSYEGKRLTIWAATPEVGDSNSQGPGAILTATGDDLLISCGGNSVLRIKELQPEGKRRMQVRDFINGAKPKPGDLFGS